MDEKIFEKITEILQELAICTKENNWDFSQIKIRSIYDSHRILNILKKEKLINIADVKP